MQPKKLFLLDGMALIYRAFFAFSKNPRITSYGLNTSAMFGFTNTLLDIIKNQKPTHIACVFDTPEPTERHLVYEEYKAHREEMPEDLSKSIPYIFRILESFNIPVITKPGYEADDIIGTIALKEGNPDFQVYMMTPDKDFGQLVNENVFIFKPARMGNEYEVMGVKEVLAKWEIDHISQVIDILAIWGDAVDNIPGIPGMGEKTAKKLVKQYGSLEAIFENVQDFKGKQQENLIQFKEQGLLSKKLATIDTNVPYEYDLKSFELEEVNKELVTELFNELEFKNLMKRVLGEETSTAKSPSSSGFDLFSSVGQTIESKPIEEFIFSSFDETKVKYKLIDNEDDLKNLVSILNQSDEFCFDTETTGLDVLTDSIIGFSFSINPSEAYYVKVFNDSVFEALKTILESDKLKIGQNIKYDFHLLKNHDINLKGPFFDTMLAHYLIEPDKKHNMDDLSRNYLNYSPISIENLIGKKGKGQLSMTQVPIEILSNYACEDADITLKLKNIFINNIQENGLNTVFDKIENPLIPVLVNMERNGVKIDQSFLKEFSKQTEQEIRILEDKIYEQAGKKFNIASPLQLGNVLFDDLKLDDKAKKTKTGQYQTGEDVLLKLVSKNPIVNDILDIRELQKLKSTYVDALPELIHPKTGRVHTTFNQAIAATGRLSSTSPNLQNIPIRTEKGREVRKAFIAGSDEHIIISADYSQIELRIIASLSEDKNMVEAFNQGLDIHTATAAKIFSVPLEQVSIEQRYKAKSVNFGLIYGQGAFGLAENLKISRTEAKEIIDSYFNQFSGIKNYMNLSIDGARKNGFVETIMGRKRYLRDINSANATVRSFAERNAINAPIQGSAADMIKLAMIDIHQEMKKRELKSKMILQVHDELLFDALKSEEEELVALVKEKMEKAMPLKVPVLAEWGKGINWLEAH